jgi:hypothetical protein
MRVSDSYMIHLSRRDCPSARAWSRNISDHSRTAATYLQLRDELVALENV